MLIRERALLIDVMKCAHCGVEVHQASLCTNCLGLYCESCSESGKCQLCGKTLTSCTLSTESIGRYKLRWISIAGSMRVGTVGFSVIPRALIDLTMASESKPKHLGYDIILFPTKKLSLGFAQIISNKFRQRYHLRMWKFSGKSRYALLESDDKRRFLLVNIDSTSNQSIGFLVQYIGILNEKTNIFASLDETTIYDTCLTILCNFNSKYSIPILPLNSIDYIFIRNITDNIKRNYLEYMAIREALKKADMAAAKEFLTHKIFIAFESMKWHDIDLFYEVSKLICQYAFALVVVSSTAESKVLNRSLRQELSTTRDNIEKKLVLHPDAIEVMTSLESSGLINNLSDEYKTYVNVICKALVQAFDRLSPRYVWLSGALGLSIIASQYKSQFGIKPEPYIEPFGLSNNFIQLCLKVFRRRNIYSEVSLMAGYTAFNLLVYKVERMQDGANLLQVCNLAEQFTNMMEREMKNIKNKNPTTTLSFVLAAELLQMAYILASIEGKKDLAKPLKIKCKRLTEKESLYETKIAISWHEYLLSFNPDCIKEIWNSFQAMTTLKQKGIAPHYSVIGNIAGALMNENSAQAYLSNAEKDAIDIIEPTIMDRTSEDMPFILRSFQSFLADQMTSEIMLLVVQTFRHLLQAANVDDNYIRIEELSAARLSSKAISNITNNPRNPLNNVTRIVDMLFNLTTNERDKKITVKTTQSCEDFTFIKLEASISYYLSLTDPPIRKYILATELQLDANDIWGRIAQALMKEQAAKAIDNTLAGKNVIVFVEGNYDVAILEAITNRIVPNNKVGFVSTDGWTNMKYFAEAKLVKSLRIPTFCVFDGDTASSKKMSIRKVVTENLRLPSNNLITLSRNSIEDYLLVPEAIKRAFPDAIYSLEEVSQYINKNKTKHNKKDVLDHLLRNYKIGKYDIDSAIRIALSFKTDEIKEELMSLIRIITNY